MVITSSDAQSQLPLTGPPVYKSCEVMFDSRKATNLAPNRSTMEFVMEPALANVMGLAVAQVQVPIAYLVIDDTCNTFELEILNNYTYTCRLEPSTYDSSKFLSAFRRALQAAGVPQYQGFQMFVDYTSGQMSLYNTVTGFRLKVLSAPLAELLGFKEQVLYSSEVGVLYDNDDVAVNNGNPVHNLRSPYMVNFAGPNTLTLVSNLAGYTGSYIRSDTARNDYLCRVPISAPFLSWNLYQHQGDMISTNGETIARVSFSLRLGDREEYTDYNRLGGPMKVNYLPFRTEAESFKVLMKFWIHDTAT